MAEEEAKKKPVFPKKYYYPTLVGALAIVLVASIATQGFMMFSFMTPQAAGDKAIDFINKNMLSEGQVAVLEKITQKNGLYFMNFSISGSKYNTFITMDGSMLFPQAVDLNIKAGTSNETSNEPADFDAPDSAIPKIDMFFMSFCPYGQMAVEGLNESEKLFGTKINIVPHYVIYDHYCGYGVNPATCTDFSKYCIANGTLCSMHGLSEVNEDIRQLCVYKYYPGKWWDYTDKIISTCQVSNVDTCWENVAKSVGVDTAKIKDCFTKEGETLIAAEKALDDQVGATASPTIFINSMPFSSMLTPEEFKTGICTAFSSKPSECSTALNSTAGAASGGCAAG